MKFSSLISWAYTSFLEKIRWITRAPVTASERQEQRSRAPTAASEREEPRSRATASYSEYRAIISTSKEPMEHKPWEPKNRPNPEKEFVLMKRMQHTIEELANSDFYSKFLQQIQTPQFLDHFSRVLGSESQFQVVIYGQFRFYGTYNIPGRIKLALILLLKRDFNDQIGEIQIFDPVFSITEVRVLEDLGFSVLRVNENAYREVSKPTLFFMHCCFPDEYDRVLRANWKSQNLNQMILLGNGLKGSKDLMVVMNEGRIRLDKNKFRPFKNRHVQIARYLMCISRFTTEIPLSSIHGDKFSKYFPLYSWHFFTWFDDVPKMKPLMKPVVVVAGIFYYLFYRYMKCKHDIIEDDEEEEDSLWKPNHSKEFRLGWLFRRRQRIRSGNKHPLLEEKNKKKKKKMFYVSRAIVLLPWFEGLPRKKWARARKIAQGVMSLLKKNDDEISYVQLDELIEAWF